MIFFPSLTRKIILFGFGKLDDSEKNGVIRVKYSCA